MNKWEYCVFNEYDLQLLMPNQDKVIKSNIVDWMNRKGINGKDNPFLLFLENLGQEGWELVSIQNTKFWFKRKLDS